MSVETHKRAWEQAAAWYRVTYKKALKKAKKKAKRAAKAARKNEQKAWKKYLRAETKHGIFNWKEIP